jgi:hypothetical protein
LRIILKPHIQHIIQQRYNIINFDSNHTANNFKKIKHVIVLIYVNNGLESLIVGWVGAILNRGKSEQAGATLNKLKFFVA